MSTGTWKHLVVSAFALASVASPGGLNAAGPGVAYVGQIPNQPSRWEYQDLVGKEAGDAMCRTIGATHVCTYSELRRLEMKGGLPPDLNTLAWLHRTEAVTLGGRRIEAGPGSNCDNWTYKTNHISDGEQALVANGKLTFLFDEDTRNPQPDLQCGGESHSILCCR